MTLAQKLFSFRGYLRRAFAELIYGHMQYGVAVVVAVVVVVVVVVCRSGGST